MFGKIYKNYKKDISELVINDIHADVFENPMHRSSGWGFDRVVKLKSTDSKLGQIVYEVEGTVSYDEGIELGKINDMEFDESVLPIIEDKPDSSARKVKTATK